VMRDHTQQGSGVGVGIGEGHRIMVLALLLVWSGSGLVWMDGWMDESWSPTCMD
jgi:hypothetical protein